MTDYPANRFSLEKRIERLEAQLQAAEKQNEELTARVADLELIRIDAEPSAKNRLALQRILFELMADDMKALIQAHLTQMEPEDPEDLQAMNPHVSAYIDRLGL